MIICIVFGAMCSLISSGMAAPLPFENNIFNDSNGPPKKSIIVKRKASEDRPNGELKQILLSSLVDGLEKNIFASALSLNKLLTDKDALIREIKFNNDSHDVTTKSHMLTNEEDNEETAKSETKTDSAVILQTTEKVPETVNVSAHIIIDRIAIQPHTGGVAPIPIFDLQEIRNVKDNDRLRDITTLTPPKTSLATAPESSSNTTTVPTEDTTASKSINIEKLKEAEKELKEKLAEIEAEPVILSARV